MIYLITKQGACAATPDEPVAAELERVGYRRVELAEFEQVKGSPAWSSQMKKIRGRKAIGVIKK